MKKYNIPFSPPDITEDEINEVAKVLKSGWITSGPKCIEFEGEIEKYCKAQNAVTVNSATSGLELILKILDIKQGDEVISTPYTYTSTSSVCINRGILPTLVDVKKGSFLIDGEKLHDAITPKTKAIMPVDIGGEPVDYDKIKEVLKAKNREDIVLLCDSAHSFGASYKGKKVGSQCDFHVFSFHAVKNLTTAEGGAVTFNNNNFNGKEDLKKELKVNSLNGQTKDAFSKMKLGSWKYDVVNNGMKCNMTDIMAAIGLVQLKRYESMLKKRRALFDIYNETLSKKEWAILPFERNEEGTETSYHLYPLRVKGLNEEKRSEVINAMAELGIATNVHFIPLPMFTLYKKLGYSIDNYPNAYAQYENEISLPLYSILKPEDAENVAKELITCVEKIINK